MIGVFAATRQFAGSWMSSWSLETVLGFFGSLTSINLGNPAADLPEGHPLAGPPDSSVKRTYGFPFTVIASAFCAPTLPSSHVNFPSTRYAGFGLRSWKSLTSRMTSPFAAAVVPVASMLM